MAGTRFRTVMMRRLLLLALLLACAIAAVAAYAFAEARRDPAVRRASIALPDWPAGAPPIRAVLISDVHIGSSAMDAARLTRIVRQVDALRPDLVLIAGDMIQGREPDSAARMGTALVEPLRGLRAPLGVVAVPGNHDHWTGVAAVEAELARARVTVLRNRAVRRGPVVIAGVDDEYTHHADVAATLAAARRLPGARIVLTHSPDIAPILPGDVRLLLAGHTHCGQIVLPIFGPLAEVSRFHARYRCGLIREGTLRTVVTAGLGTSEVPLRLGAPPDLWLLTLGPATLPGQ